MEFVALGMSAKVVVIIDNQNPGVGPCVLAKEIGGSQAADSAAHNDEIVGFLVIDRIRPGLAIAHPMRHFPGSVMAPTHAGFSRRIIGGIFFRRRIRR